MAVSHIIYTIYTSKKKKRSPIISNNFSSTKRDDYISSHQSIVLYFYQSSCAEQEYIYFCGGEVPDKVQMCVCFCLFVFWSSTNFTVLQSESNYTIVFFQ